MNEILKRIEKGIELKQKQNEDYLQEKIVWFKDRIKHCNGVDDIMFAIETFQKHYDNYNENKIKYREQENIIILLEVETNEKR